MNSGRLVLKLGIVKFRGRKAIHTLEAFPLQYQSSHTIMMLATSSQIPKLLFKYWELRELSLPSISAKRLVSTSSCSELFRIEGLVAGYKYMAGRIGCLMPSHRLLHSEIQAPKSDKARRCQCPSFAIQVHRRIYRLYIPSLVCCARVDVAHQ
ncbi:hypothetical protein BJY01DRAFT_79750 [Aspergillus pseudoustus]|uniref:Uncharacterized protein n=1 Tax=Aspergillus pseudoustus TaxID=1810923 RepID=A0ABR4J463_9EURO